MDSKYSNSECKWKRIINQHLVVDRKNKGFSMGRADQENFTFKSVMTAEAAASTTITKSTATSTTHICTVNQKEFTRLLLYVCGSKGPFETETFHVP
jgi:hypothetical protein